MDSYKEEGVGERCYILIADDALDADENLCLDVKAAKDDGKCLAHHIEKKRIHAKGKQTLGQDVVLAARLVVDKLQQDAQYPGGESAGYEYVAGTPDALVDAETNQGESEA